MDLHKVGGVSCPPFLLLKSQQAAITTVIPSPLRGCNALFLHYGPVPFFLLASPFLLTFSQKKGYACQENSHLHQDVMISHEIPTVH